MSGRGRRRRDDSASSVDYERKSTRPASLTSKHSARRKSEHNRDEEQDSKSTARQYSHRRDRDESDEGARHRKQRSERSSGDSRRHRDDQDRKHGGRSRSRDRSHDRSRDRRHSRSPPAKKRRRSRSISKSPVRKSRTALPSQNESFRGETGLEGAEVQPEKQKPNFKPTGLLAKEANTVAGTTTVLKYHEPPEGRKPPPKEQWRMYVFKEKDLVDTIYLHTRSVWLCGRDKKVTDLLLEHPSISKQHAVIQFRYITSTNEFGDKSSKVKPYLIDLDSANGTKLNGKKVDGSKYVELLDGDVVGFGDSEREVK
ncbi:hypothetical protein LTR56_026176 [Elasticomyces elasticus]|nr:hypothetical protein LTR56_026176 [Elasticomyces elasticus]KAK4926227.1 hypothetical protein LTR49_006932 [Elasticomyces elasticus]